MGCGLWCWLGSGRLLRLSRQLRKLQVPRRNALGGSVPHLGPYLGPYLGHPLPSAFRRGTCRKVHQY